MCGVAWGLTTVTIGVLMVLGTTIVGYGVLPDFIDDMILGEVILTEDTIQMERFEEVPVVIDFNVRVFNISNPDDVMNGGVPILKEVGPYVYKMIQRRVVEELTDDLITYRILYNYEFDPESSYPLTEDDQLTIVNLPYHAILQAAEEQTPALMGILNAALGGIFNVYNSPITTVRLGNLTFGGMRLCDNPGFLATVACNQIRALSAGSPNLALMDDHISFSLFGYKDNIPSQLYVADRGLSDPARLGSLVEWDHRPRLPYWMDVNSQCNMLNGTDTGIFAPKVNPDSLIYGFNVDICRSVLLRYQHDENYEGIPVLRFAVNEWFLSNDEGCFCLNVTRGVQRENGCLKQGAQELYSCVGSYMVLSYPHFLFADDDYKNGVIGMTPNQDIHRIYLDLEPNTGTVIRGAKRAQFNIFLKEISGIRATSTLATTLTPIFWAEERIELPDDFVDEVKTKLLGPLNLVAVAVPVAVTLSLVVLLAGTVMTAVAYKKRSAPQQIDEPKTVSTTE